MKKFLAAALLSAAPAAFAQEADAPAQEPALDVSTLPFTTAAIKKVMAFHQPKIQDCYEELMATQEKVVQGKLMTSFVITKEGLVSKPKILKKGTTLRDQKLHDCVVAVLTSMEFPKPKRDQPIEYPINLKAIK